MKVIRLGTSPDNWIFSSAPYRVRRAWSSISCCSAWFNRRVGAMTRMDRSRRSGVSNSSSTSSRWSPYRRDAYQTQRRNIDLAAKSSAGVRSGISVLYCSPPNGAVDGAASGRSCGSAAATRFNISRTSSGGSSTANTVVTLERVSAGRPGEVREGCGSQHRVRHDQQPAAGVDMCGAPVDFDHAASCRRRFYPVAEPERLLEQDEQARDDLADGVLQGQPEHDRRHA